MIQPVATSDALLHEIRALIEDARRQVAHAANAGLTIAYWRIGKRLLTENLTDGRGEYGQQILASLAQQLERDYGKGFSYSALTRMARFAELFPDERILVSLIQELTWTHFIALLPLKDPLAREFYAEMCRVERWSVRTLRQKIGGMLFERTALSKNSPEVVRQELATLRDGRMTPDMVFRDPYLLDFLGLSGVYSEKDLEAAILREMESFQPSHKGQMELYLRWLDKHERTVGEEAPIGLILCASADAEQVELLQLDEASIRVAEYLVELPPVAVLRERLHRAIEHARERTALAAPEGDQE